MCVSQEPRAEAPARGGHERTGRESAPAPTHGGRGRIMYVYVSRPRCAGSKMQTDRRFLSAQVSSGSRTRSPAGGGGDQGHASPKPPPAAWYTPVPVPVDGSIGGPRGHGGSLSRALALSLAANRTGWGEGRRDRPQLEANDQTWIGGKSNAVDRQKSGDDAPGQADRPPQTAGLASD